MKLEVTFKDVFSKLGEEEASKKSHVARTHMVNFPLFPKHLVKNSIVH